MWSFPVLDPSQIWQSLVSLIVFIGAVLIVVELLPQKCEKDFLLGVRGTIGNNVSFTLKVMFQHASDHWITKTMVGP